MNNFEKLLKSSNKEIKASRAKIVAEDVTDAAEELLRDAKKKKRDVEKRILGLSDLHKDSELSLRVVKTDFNAKQWLNDLHAAEIELMNAEIELSAAEKIYGKWFTEVAEDETTKEGLSEQK
jgi:hypothetical protein